MEQSHTQWYIGAPNGIILCINGKIAGMYYGEMFDSYHLEGTPFCDLGQMTLLMEKLYDDLQFPFEGTNERSFSEQPKETKTRQERKRIMSDDQLLQRHGDIGTFIVRVQHRQNSSWQGRITWMEQDKTIQFRSVWEMIKLIESAVDTVSVSEDGDNPSWSE